MVLSILIHVGILILIMVVFRLLYVYPQWLISISLLVSGIYLLCSHSVSVMALGLMMIIAGYNWLRGLIKHHRRPYDTFYNERDL